MFLFNKESMTNLLVFDTDDCKFEVVKEDDFCRYIMETGKVVDNTNGFMRSDNSIKQTLYRHDMITQNIPIYMVKGKYCLGISGSANGFLCMDTSSFLVRVFSQVYVLHNGIRDGLSLYMRRGNSRSLYLLLNSRAYGIHISGGDVSVPGMEHIGLISRDKDEICDELVRSGNRDIFLPFVGYDIKKRVLIRV